MHYRKLHEIIALIHNFTVTSYQNGIGTMYMPSNNQKANTKIEIKKNVEGGGGILHLSALYYAKMN